MPRKIGYGRFTPARKAALRKAQLESARKRRKHHSDERTRRKRRNRQLAAVAVGAAAAAGVGAAIYQGQQKEKKQVQAMSDREFMFGDNAAEAARLSEASKSRAAARAELAQLKAAAGDINMAAENQEQWDARVKLYGDVIGEFSPEHDGRAEIFPTIPRAELVKMFQQEAVRPSYNLLEANPNEEFVTLYHRTGGGNDLDAQTAKASLLQNQTFQVLNRDEKRIVKVIQDRGQFATEAQTGVNNNLSWFSDKLNDSNTRAAFGEHVVQLKVPKSIIKQARLHGGGPNSFGKMSPIQESWVAIPPELLQGIKIEDAQHLVTPPLERKFRAPK